MGTNHDNMIDKEVGNINARIGHTPGEWTMYLNENNRFEILGNGGTPVAEILGAKGHFEQNARLISMAPELLDLAHKFANHLHAESEEGGEGGIVCAEETPCLPCKIIASATGLSKNAPY